MVWPRAQPSPIGGGEASAAQKPQPHQDESSSSSNSETIPPEPFIYEEDPGTTLEETQKAATPKTTPQQAVEPSIPVLDLSSPQPSQEPSTPVLGLSSPTTSPAGTSVLHLIDEKEDIMDQDQPKD